MVQDTQVATDWQYLCFHVSCNEVGKKITLGVKVRNRNISEYQSQFCITDITLNIKLVQRVTRVAVPLNIRGLFARTHTFDPHKNIITKLHFFIYSNDKSLFKKQSILMVLNCHMVVFFLFYYSLEITHDSLCD